MASTEPTAQRRAGTPGPHDSAHVDHSSNTYSSGAGSYASVGGHPIHPVLVHATIGLFLGAVIADIAFVGIGNAFWNDSARWLVLATVLAGGCAVIPGLIDLLSIDRARRLPAAYYHAGLNALFLSACAVNYWMRGDNGASPTTGLVLTLASLLLVAISGWLGGQLVYKHGIGVSSNVGRPDR